MRRATIVGGLGFALGLVTGLLLAPSGASRDETASSGTTARDAPPTAARDADTDRPDDRSRVRARPADAPEPAPSDRSMALVLPPRRDGDPDVREFQVPDAPSGWVDLEVRIHDSDGSSGSSFSFQVVAEGTEFDPHRDDDDILVQGETGPEGAATVRVASPRRHRVIVEFGHWFLAADVAVPATRRVELREPVWEPMQVRLGDELGAEVQVVLTPLGGAVTTAEGTIVVPLPSNPLTAQVSRGAPTALLHAPSVLRWRFTAPPGWRCEPAEAAAPCEVRVVRAVGSPLAFSARLRSSDPLLSCERLVEVTWDAGAGAVEQSFGIGPGQPADGCRTGGALPAAGRRGVLRWSGPEIAAGEAEYDLDAAASIDVDVLHRPGSPADARSARLVVRSDVPAGSETPLEASVWDSADAHSGRSVAVTGDAEVRLPAGDRWFLALRNEDDPLRARDVAGPVRVVAGSRREIALVPGGRLIVVPRSMPPAGTGQIEIVRADGAPLLWCDSDGDVHATLHAPAVAGTVLGPLEPGTVVLDVLVGRVLWQRFEALVREDEHTPLPIGPFGKRER